MAKRILIIGGSGFIGRALCAALAKNSYSVCAASRSASLPPLEGVRSVVCDGSAPDELAPLLADCDTVVHLASASTPGSTAAQPLAEIDANLRPTLALLEAMQTHPGLPLLYLSSAGSLYGESAEATFTEGDALQPRSYHGAGKAAAEHFIGAWCRQFSGSATILRPSNVYGPGQHERAGFGIVPHAMGALFRRETLVVWGEGSAARDYLFVDDLIVLCLKVLGSTMPSGVRTFNASSGTAVGLNELFALMEAAIGRTLARRYQRARTVDASRVAIDSGLARQTFGWEPKVDLPEGLRRTWDWLQSTQR